MSICGKKISPEDEDKWPMLPPTDDDSCDELSPIEEESSSSSNSAASDTSNSKYVSSFLGSSTPSVSSTSEVSSYKNLHDEYGTPTDHEFDDTRTESDSSNNSEKSTKSQQSRRRISSTQATKNDLNFDEIEVDIQHQEYQECIKSYNDPSRNQDSRMESVIIVQQTTQINEEIRQETLVEVDEEIPFEAVLNGLSDRIRHEGNNSQNSSVSRSLESFNQ